VSWAKVEKNGSFGFIDKSGKEIVPVKYDNISYFGSSADNWAKVEYHGKQGFINKQGEEIVETKYDRIYSFGSKGIKWALVSQDGKLGFIDRTGREVVVPKYDNISYFNRNESNWSLVELNGKYGFIDRNGFEIIPPALNDFRNDELIELAFYFPSRGNHIDNIGPVKNYRVSPFVGDYAVIKSKKNGKIGVINKNFEVVVPVEHDKIMIDDTGNIHVW